MSVTLKSAVAEGADTLAANGVDQPRNESCLLLMHVAGCDRTFLLAHSEDTLSPEDLARFRSLVARRAGGEPLQYISGRQEFFKLDFEVNPDVLIPRPETESIVEVGVELLKEERAARFADIGTGSGCIAICLLHELPQARAVATDFSRAALTLAKRNSERHRVADRLRLVESDLLSALDPAEPFDLIVSNPPYVPAHEMSALQPEVRREPQSALDGGPQGLDIIRRLLNQAPQYLKANGYLVFEIGFGQEKEVKQLIDTAVWELIDLRKDLQGIPRTIVLRKSS